MKRRLLATLAITLFAAGCGSGSEPSQDPTAGPHPRRIVSLSATATEMLFAIGAGPQVVAVDEFSTFPVDAPRTDLSGFTPNAEAIAAKDPDLVVISNDIKEIAAQLERLQIETHLAPAAVTIDDTYRQISDLGELTGHVAEAEALNQQMKDEIAKLVAEVPKRIEPLTYYYEVDPALYSVTSKTFVGSLFTMVGLTNIADPADTDGTGYPQLSAEAVIGANPDLIFLADTVMGETPEKVKARAGWASITAVSEGQVFALDTDIASRWGPRVVDLMRSIADAVGRVQA